jgi:hypothetical protein
MLRLINILALAVFLLCFGMSNARADSTQYIVTGIFGPSTPTTAFSAPNSTFTITFTEPAIVPVTQVGPAAFSTNISVHYSTSDGVKQSFPAYDPSTFQGVGETFLNPSLTVGSNLAITYIDSSNNIYSWSFDGAQLFSGLTSNPILIPGTFPIATGVIGSNFTCFIVSVENNPCTDVYPLTSGSITATSEPGSLAFLSSGLLLLIALGRKSILT